VPGLDDPDDLVPRRRRAHPLPALAQVVHDLAEGTLPEPVSGVEAVPERGLDLFAVEVACRPPFRLESRVLDLLVTEPALGIRRAFVVHRASLRAARPRRGRAWTPTWQGAGRRGAAARPERVPARFRGRQKMTAWAMFSPWLRVWARRWHGSVGPHWRSRPASGVSACSPRVRSERSPMSGRGAVSSSCR